MFRVKARVFEFFSKKVLQYFAEMPPERFVDDLDIQRILLKIACTPLIFGGAREKVRLGKNVKLVNALLNVSSGTISVGDNTFFGHNVMLLTGTHDVEMTGAERQHFPESGRDIVVGHGVWLASGVTVLGPCEIEDDVVVGAGSVVCGGRLEAGCLYVGVPARKIRRIHNEDGCDEP